MDTDKSDSISSTIEPSPDQPLTRAARDLAISVLSADPVRLRHIVCVVSQARRFAVTVDASHRDSLVAAAWLHDIGYAPQLRQSGFHPVDGANYLRGLGWPEDVCNLVAHHSGARFVAAERGDSSLLDSFPFADDDVSDALTLADQTSGPHGDVMDIEDRMRDVQRRHGPNSPNARAFPRRSVYIRQVRDRVQSRLDACEQDEPGAAVAASARLDQPVGVDGGRSSGRH